MNFLKQIRKRSDEMIQRENGLKRLREEQRFNQKEMAVTIGVSASYYYKVESGYQNPSYDFLCKLKKRFPEADIDELFFQKEKPAWNTG